MNLIFFSSMNLIKSNTVTILFFKKVYISIFTFSLYSVLSDLMNQIFIFNIHDCSERSHLGNRVLSITIVYQKVITNFLNYFFLFVVFCWSKEIFNSSIEYFHFSMVIGVIRYSIDSKNSFRFLHFFRKLFKYSHHLSVSCQLGILYRMKHFLDS